MNRDLFCLLPLFLTQYQIDPVRPFEEMKLGRKVETQSPEQAANRISTEKRREFEKKVDGMIEALASFTEAYNKSMGKVWPEREARTLKKAILDLQQTDAWFSEGKGK